MKPPLLENYAGNVCYFEVSGVYTDYMVESMLQFNLVFGSLLIFFVLIYANIIYDNEYQTKENRN